MSLWNSHFHVSNFLFLSLQCVSEKCLRLQPQSGCRRNWMLASGYPFHAGTLQRWDPTRMRESFLTRSFTFFIHSVNYSFLPRFILGIIFFVLGVLHLFLIFFYTSCRILSYK